MQNTAHHWLVCGFPQSKDVESAPDIALKLSIIRGMRFLISLCVICVVLRDSALAAPKVRYFPPIKEASIRIEITSSKPQIARDLVIKDSRGKPAYELHIVAISMDKHTTHSVHLELNTTGQYAADPEVKYEPNLLSPDYWGHGVGREVIHPEEVCPANRNNPVVGAHRDFTFRKMQIAVTVEDVELSSGFCSEDECSDQVGGFKRLRLIIVVKQSASMRRRPAGYDELGWKFLELKKCR
jgi:hypothetical protein